MHYDVAVDFVHTECCPDQLNHGSRFTSTAELSSTENNETKYIRSPLLAAWRMLMDFVTLNKQKSTIKSPDKKSASPRSLVRSDKILSRRQTPVALVYSTR